MTMDVTSRPPLQRSNLRGKRSAERRAADLQAAFGESSPLHQHVPYLEAGRTALERLRTRLVGR